jgi:hypothetical protein
MAAGVVRHSKNQAAMSALGQKQTLRLLEGMSALLPKADMDQPGCDVRFVPTGDIALFHLAERHQI